MGVTTGASTSSVDKRKASRREVASRAPHTSSHAFVVEHNQRNGGFHGFHFSQRSPGLRAWSRRRSRRRQARVRRARASPCRRRGIAHRQAPRARAEGRHLHPEGQPPRREGRCRASLTYDSSATRCDAVVRSRRRPRPTPVASVRAATDRVLGFWLALFSDLSSLSVRSTHRVPRASSNSSSPTHGHD